jgi:DNA processing protein
MNTIERSISPETLLGRDLNDVEMKHAPKMLYISGTLEAPISSPRIAIVGTRAPSSEGKRIAFDLASNLSEKDVIIVSGLARGIDTEAHKGALYKNGKTMAVLGTPLSICYPAENCHLQAEIAKKGLLVTQFPSNQPVQRKNFVIRNRTMALICDASIIIEAGDSSGTLSQGWEVLRLGRPLFIWKSVFRNKQLKWPEELLNYGAMVVDDIPSILEQIPYGKPSGVPIW